MKNKEEAILTFGLQADVQYTPDLREGVSGWGRTRWYYDTLNKIAPAVECWNNEKVSFAVNLGDLCERRGKQETSLASVKTVIQSYKNAQFPIHFVFGNHDVEQLHRSQVIQTLGISNGTDEEGDLRGYYSFVKNNHRILALDTYDIAMFGREANHKNLQQAQRILSEGKKKYPKDAHFQPWNGAVGDLQLKWIAKELEEAKEKKERVIVVCHAPLLPACSYGCQDAVVWNYREVLDLFQKSGNVIACFYGHEHMGSKLIEHKGILHMTIPAPLESKVGEKSHAVVRVFQNLLEIEGHGNVPSESGKITFDY